MKRKMDRGSPRGIALIMALYITVILLALGTFFIADQINKSRSVKDYADSKMALEAANAGLNLIVNYLGDVEHDWADSIILEVPPGNGSTQGTPVCGATSPFLYANTYHIQFGGGSGVKLFVPVPNSSLYESDYPFTITDPIQVSSIQNKVAVVSGTLKLFTYVSEKNSCNSPGDFHPEDLSSVSVDVVAQINNGEKQGNTLVSGNYTFASREVQWSGARHPLVRSLYQCWTCWDVVGNKFPNPTDGTDVASYVDSGYTANTSTGDLGKQQSSNTSTSPDSSPYGADQNGFLSVKNDYPSLGTPQFNGAILATQNVSCAGCDVKSASPAALPTGTPFGPALDASGNAPATQTAPSTMLQELNQAANYPGCGGTVKTVFVASSQDVGPGVQGGTPHDVEYDPTGVHQKPGYAVTDITLNANGSVTVNQLGYYSGSTLYSETFNPSQINNGQNVVLYVQGGNVRVHGNLAGAGLTVVANQGEAFYNASGQDVTPSSTTSCYAPNPNHSNQPYAANTAERVNSNAGGPGAAGTNYWIPGACSPCSPSNFTLTDGIYTNASGQTVGYHADNVNGQPITMSLNLGNCGANGCNFSVGSSNNSIFAPAPIFDTTNGKLVNPNSTAGLDPTSYEFDTSKPVSVITPVKLSQNQEVWPYPGASALPQILNGQVGDTLIYTRQSEYSDGNLTVSGDTGFTGTASGLGLVAQNFVLLNDFVAGTTGNTIPGAKSASNIKDYNLNVRADIISVNHSVEWEGNTVSEPTCNPSLSPGCYNSPYQQDAYVNGDYTAMHNQYYQNGAQQSYNYTYTYKGNNYTAQADSWQGAPLQAPSGYTSAVTSEPNPNKGEYWQYIFQGSAFAPYQDVVNTTDAGGNQVAYSQETLYSDDRNNPPSFPVWDFRQWKNADLLAIYQTLSYLDLGALQTTAGP